MPEEPTISDLLAKSNKGLFRRYAERTKTVPETTKITSSRVEGELDEVLKAAHALAEEHHLLGSAGYSLLVKQLFNLAVALAHAKHPAYVLQTVGAVDAESIKDLCRPSGIIIMPLPVVDDVLDKNRAAGLPCGIQVLAPDHVVCWFGDVQDAMRPLMSLGWGSNRAPTLFHESRGDYALEEAAKWLRDSANG